MYHFILRNNRKSRGFNPTAVLCSRLRLVNNDVVTVRHTASLPVKERWTVVDSNHHQPRPSSGRGHSAIELTALSAPKYACFRRRYNSLRQRQRRHQQALERVIAACTIQQQHGWPAANQLKIYCHEKHPIKEHCKDGNCL